jgi:hypothetical protein
MVYDLQKHPSKIPISSLLSVNGRCWTIVLSEHSNCSKNNHVSIECLFHRKITVSLALYGFEYHHQEAVTKTLAIFAKLTIIF